MPFNDGWRNTKEGINVVKGVGWNIAIMDVGPVEIEINDFWDRTRQYYIRRGWRNDICDYYLAWMNTR